MRLSIARTSAGGHTPGEAANRADAGFDVRSTAWRRMALALSAVLLLGCIGIVSGSSKPAGAATVFAPGQVFASVGGSQVNVYDPTSGGLVNTLNDGTNEPYTAGSAFDADGNLYVTDDINGTISKYAPDGTFDGTFASGLTNPLSLVFDNQGNLYVGQQGTPYIAEFNSSGQSIGNFGPVTTGETGDDWIALSSDECTFYYTTETDVIYRYNKCTNTQLSTFNVAPLHRRQCLRACRFWRTGTCSSRTPSRTSCSTPTATSSAPTRAQTFPDVPESSSPSPSTPTGCPFGPATHSRGTSIGSTSRAATCSRPSTRSPSSSSACR